jgi:integrating conjugative element protein (TIGR03761 family)
MNQHVTPLRLSADDIGPPATAADGVPGPLHPKVSLTTQSRYARLLVLGRSASADTPAIMGLLAFADQLRVIWNAARADDPWADWWLIRIDDAIDLVSHRLETATTKIEHYLRTQSALEIDIATSERPYRVKLRFVNPYAYRGAQLVAEFDAAVRTILTARHVGLINSDQAHRTMMSCSGVLRSLFAMPQGFRVFRLDRAAVKAGGPAVAAATDSLGPVPPAVLLGAHRPRLAPRTATA